MIPLLLASLIVPDPGDVVIPPDAIVQVLCTKGKDLYAGTAFRVGNGLMVSVRHVTSEGKCTIAGAPIAIAWTSPTADFSMLKGAGGAALKVDCGGFVKGRSYVALGYGRGVTPLTKVELVATGESQHGEALLVGMFAVVPGQSGGPIVDAETGEAVGTVNMENYEVGVSWSVPLSDTPVCRK